MRKLFSKPSGIISTLIWIVMLVSIWEMTSYYLKDVVQDPMYLQKLPSLVSIFGNIFQNFDSLIEAGFITTSRALCGLVVGSVVGFFVAVILNFSKILEKMIFPHLIVFQMIPVLALAPIVYSIVKDQDVAKIVLSAFITFFPVTINVYSGLKSIDLDMKKVLHIFAARPLSVFTKLLVPASLPSLYTGLKLAAPSAITAGILVEMLGADSGIGIKILSGIYYGTTGALSFWGSVLVAAFLGLASYYIIVILEKITVPWIKEEGN